MIYLIIANVALMISFVLYQSCFRKLTFFQWNRFYLLGTVLVSLLIPVGIFIDLSSFRQVDAVLPTIDIAEFVDMPFIQVTTAVHTYSLADLLMTTYWTGVVLSAVFLLYRFMKLRELFKQSSDYFSFSFFNRVFLGRQVAHEAEIEAHEWVHVKQGHSYDVLFMELVTVFNWFNPALYFMRKELKFQHECIADELCAADKVAYAELLVAHALQVQPSALQHEFSNYSFLKKRIMMLFKNKSAKTYKLFYLSLIPFLLIVAGSTLVFNTSKARTLVSTVEEQIHDVALHVQRDMPMEELVPELAAQVEANTQKDDFSSESLVFAEQDTSKKGGSISKDSPSRSHVDQGGNELFTSVEINPAPKNGMDAFRRWIADNYQYPLAAIDAGVKGTITVSFIVETDGKLSNIKILKDLSHGTGEAAVNLMKKAENWNPGIQNGRAVRTAYTLPIRLDLTEVGEKKTDHVFSSVEVNPSPKIGMDGFRKWIADNYEYPVAAIDAGVKGTVTVSFVVETDGRLSDIKVLKDDIGLGTAEAAIKLMEKAEPWNPGTQKGESVRTGYALPIRLDLTQM